MDRRCVFLIVLFCSPAIGLAQPEEGSNDRLRLKKPEAQVLVGPVRSKRNLQRPEERVFDTFPMPNLYQENHAVAMPNAYWGDNCVPMPNLYRANPTERIITLKLDNASEDTHDTLRLQELDKLKNKLKKQQPEE